MGTKRISIRTLPDGSKVKHHPPDEQHPDGKLVLIRETSPLRDRLEAQMEDNERRHRQLKDRQARRLQAKKDRQQNKGRPVPGEKTGF